eukprot:162681_1
MTLSSSNWNITLGKDDLLDDDDDIRFIYGGWNSSYLETDGHVKYVLFLGEPVLEQLTVTLNKNDDDYDTIIFYYTSSSSSTDWFTIVIVLAAVVAFAIIFFGLYFWKYGKIPAHTNHDVEEQSLLRGPLQQSSSLNNNNANQAFSQGQPQDNQLQQAQRQQPPQRSQPSGPQAIGSGSGQAPPQNPDDLRLRRLKFLEEQEKKAQEQQNDDNL